MSFNNMCSFRLKVNFNFSIESTAMNLFALTERMSGVKVGSNLSGLIFWFDKTLLISS